ncbi:hypothetical protein HID58_074158 [Brassica napus]|uniref:Uncharacterized protein n=1 Tax=Brassica napus TaxID=3708 RepID=A0ABQ7YG51_BRANA|nr:hypothetical protein HID58_074158 [Brassica napus]
MTWKWRIGKDHNVGPSKRSKGGYHRRARSGRASRNACIKGDATAHTQFAFLEALWLDELCGGVYGSGPRNSKRENLGEAKNQEDEEAVMHFKEGLRAGFLAAFSILDAPLVLML